MEQVRDLWEMLRRHLGAWVGPLPDLPPDRLLPIAFGACLVAFLLLISRLRAGRAYRRMRDERDELKQQLATLQATYDSEVRWRRASEALDTSKAPQ